MKKITNILLTSTFLFLMEQTVYAMQREEEREISLTLSKSREFTRKKEKQLTLADSAQGLGSEIGGKIALTFSQKLLEDGQVDAVVSGGNLENLTTYKSHIDMLSAGLLAFVPTFLDLRELGRALQVSSQWKSTLDVPDMWKIIGLRDYEEYFTAEDLIENAKQSVVSHFLSVHVNALENLDEIKRIVQHYRLDLYKLPFKDRLNNLNMDMIKNIADKEEFIAQGNKRAILEKIEGLIAWRYGYKKDLIAAKKFNDALVEEGNLKAIERKIEECSRSRWNKYAYSDAHNYADGYEYLYKREDILTARKLNDSLIERGNVEAIHRKIEGLSWGLCGYKKNPIAARELNDSLVKNGDNNAIERKFQELWVGKKTETLVLRCLMQGAVFYTGEWAFTIPTYCYEKNPAAAREFNDSLVEKGNVEAIHRKIEGLLGGKYSYELNPTAAKEYSEFLIEQGDQTAIDRKLEGLSEGKCGYEKNPAAAREFNDSLVKQGGQKAIKRKLEGLSEGKYGYEKNPTAAREFNDSLVKQGGQKAIKRKLEGLSQSKYGYEKSPENMRAFIENDLILENYPMVRRLGHYLKVLGLKYGQFGYERNREEAIEYIKRFNVPF